MGRLDRIKQVANSSNSVCLDLNEGNVQSIFNRCLAKKGDFIDDCVQSRLFTVFGGYDPSLRETSLLFDREAMLANRKAIKYLLGQLKNVHINKVEVLIKEAFQTYQDTYWGTKEGVIYLLYLAAAECWDFITPLVSWQHRANHFLSQIRQKSVTENDSFLVGLDEIKPTLSPKDPAFPEWWEQHKAEWED